MPGTSEWRDLGVPVLQTRYTDPFERESFRAHQDELLAMIETGPGPFIRLLDVRDTRIPMGEIDSLLYMLRHPAMLHPWQRYLVMISSAPPGEMTVSSLLQERIATTAIFSTMEEAEAYICREGPALIARPGRD